MKNNNKGITTISPLPQDVESFYDDILLGKRKQYCINGKILWLSEKKIKALRERKDESI